MKFGEILKGSKVVVVLIGNGLKDLNIVVDILEIKFVILLIDEDSIFEYVKGVVCV